MCSSRRWLQPAYGSSRATLRRGPRAAGPGGGRSPGPYSREPVSRGSAALSVTLTATLAIGRRGIVAFLRDRARAGHVDLAERVLVTVPLVAGKAGRRQLRIGRRVGARARARRG